MLASTSPPFSPASHPAAPLCRGVTSPTSRARGAYGAGRAAEAFTRKHVAATWFAPAAEHATTYYGQLARAKAVGEAAGRLAAEPKPTAEESAQFRKRELVRVVQMLGEVGETDRLGIFMQRLSDLANTPSEHVMIASLFESVGRLDLSVGPAN